MPECVAGAIGLEPTGVMVSKDRACEPATPELQGPSQSRGGLLLGGYAVFRSSVAAAALARNTRTWGRWRWRRPFK